MGRGGSRLLRCFAPMLAVIAQDKGLGSKIMFLCWDAWSWVGKGSLCPGQPAGYISFSGSSCSSSHFSATMSTKPIFFTLVNKKRWVWCSPTALGMAPAEHRAGWDCRSYPGVPSQRGTTSPPAQLLPVMLLPETKLILLSFNRCFWAGGINPGPPGPVLPPWHGFKARLEKGHLLTRLVSW